MFMESQYRDKDGKPLTKEEVRLMPPGELGARSGLPVNILPDNDSIYEIIADIMIETIQEKNGEKAAMILPVGPTGQYPLLKDIINKERISLKNCHFF